MTGPRARPVHFVRCALAALRLQWRASRAGSLVNLALTLAIGVLPATGAWLMKELLDGLAGGRASAGTLGLLAAGAAASTGLIVALALVSGFVFARVRRALTLTVERALFEHVARIEGLAPFEDPVFHDRLQLAQQAAQDAPHQVADFVLLALQAALTLGSLAGVVFAVSPLVALAYLTCVITGLAASLVRIRSQAALMTRLTEVFRRRDFYRATLLDPRAAKEIRLFGIGGLLVDRLLAAIARATADADKVERRSLLWQAGLVLANAAATAVGAVLVVEGAIAGRHQLGDVALFVAAAGGIQHMLSQLLGALATTGTAIATFQTYLEVVGSNVLVAAAPRRAPVPLADAIVLEDVWFRYREDQPWVLAGVDLRIPAGRSVGLVGLNGAGKSTLVKLLCGMYAPTRGRVLWDGTDLRELDPARLRERISATFQDFMTYDLTASENIGLGDVASIADRGRIRAAAARAGIEAQLAALPAGYDTLLSRVLAADDFAGGAGMSLSGGQWQRVALARALMRPEADLMILDEPSAGLDAEAEHALHETLARHGAGRTRLLISHRLGSMRGADQLAVLEGGRIIERGTHTELVDAPTRYARLFSLQAAGYVDPAPCAEAG
jgi:ATP-binding cassette, subfamily B, bacterial